MKLRLVVVADARLVEERHFVDEFGIEPKPLGKCCLFRKIDGNRLVIGSRPVGAGVEQESRHPVELALDLLAPDDAIDGVDGGELRVPDRRA